MGVFENLIKVDDEGNIIYNQWIEWQHFSIGISHCPICLALDKCWFSNNIMPLLPQHENCHCYTLPISTPSQTTINAECATSKFRDYIFSDKYAWNGKRDLFEKLGFTINDSEYLRSEYERQAKTRYSNSQYRLGKLDIRGQRVDIDIKFVKNNRNITFTSGWMVRPKGVLTNNTPLGN